MTGERELLWPRQRAPNKETYLNHRLRSQGLRNGYFRLWNEEQSIKLSLSIVFYDDSAGN